MSMRRPLASMRVKVFLAEKSGLSGLAIFGIVEKPYMEWSDNLSIIYFGSKIRVFYSRKWVLDRDSMSCTVMELPSCHDCSCESKSYCS